MLTRHQIWGAIDALAAAHGAAALLGLEVRRGRDVAGFLHALDDLLDQLLELIASVRGLLRTSDYVDALRARV